jgi:hypothetical protein
MASIYNKAKKKFMDAGIALAADTIKIALLTNSYTPNIDTDEFWSDISANEAVASGYTAGGIALGSKLVTVDTVNDKSVFDAADTAITLAATITYRYAVIYKSTGTAGTSPLIYVHDFGAGGVVAPAGTLTLQYNASGIINFV